MLKSLIATILVSFYSVTETVIPAARAASDTNDWFLASIFFQDLKMVLAILTGGLILALTVLLFRVRRLHEKFAAQTEAAPKETTSGGPLQEQWAEVMRHLDSPREGEWKYAVIEADKLTDDQLRQRFPGETMGERLMNIDKTKLLTIDGLWEAHKTRNRLAHDTNYFLRHAEAIRAIKLFEQTLKELEVL